MQALYLLALLPIAETKADRSSYGFRPDRSAHDALQHCYIAFAGNNKAQWVLDADIEGCFDNISHQWLLENIPIDKRMLTRWLDAGFIESQSFNPTTGGVPQGGVISPTLANMALDGLEAIVRDATKGRKVNFIRYADDFIATADSKELLEDTIIPLIDKFIATRGSRLSPEKTRIVHIDEGFDFLGFNIRKYQGKYLGKPSKANVKSFTREIKQVVRKGYGHSGAALIRQLNPKIRGWANYYRIGVAKATYAKMDNCIYKLCMHWVMRRYDYHCRYKAVNKYFRRRSAMRGWIFSDLNVKSNGIKEVVSITKMMDVRIQRHVLMYRNFKNSNLGYIPLANHFA